MIHPLNIPQPEKRSENQIWESGICIGLTCRNLFSAFGPGITSGRGPGITYVSGIVMVGEIYRTVCLTTNVDMFIYCVFDDICVGTKDISTGRRSRSGIDFLLNKYTCKNYENKTILQVSWSDG